MAGVDVEVKIRPKPYLLKAPPADMDRWVADARAAGVPFAEHIRRALDAAGARPQPWTPAQRAEHRRKTRRSSTRAKNVERTTMCEHRRPPGTYCGTCKS